MAWCGCSTARPWDGDASLRQSRGRPCAWWGCCYTAGVPSADDGGGGGGGGSSNKGCVSARVQPAPTCSDRHRHDTPTYKEHSQMAVDRQHERTVPHIHVALGEAHHGHGDRLHFFALWHGTAPNVATIPSQQHCPGGERVVFGKGLAIRGTEAQQGHVTSLPRGNTPQGKQCNTYLFSAAASAVGSTVTSDPAFLYKWKPGSHLRTSVSCRASTLAGTASSARKGSFSSTSCAQCAKASHTQVTQYTHPGTQHPQANPIHTSTVAYHLLELTDGHTIIHSEGNTTLWLITSTGI